MKILLLTPQFPYPPEQGTSLRNYFILTGLSLHHEVSLISYRESNFKLVNFDDLSRISIVGSAPMPRRSTSHRLFQLLTTGQADMSLRLRSDEFEGLLRSELAETTEINSTQKPYDIVQIEGIELAHLIPIVRKASPLSKIVYDAHNAETNLQIRSFKADTSRPSRWPAAAYSWVQVRRLRTYESWACQNADWVVAVSHEDLIHLQELVPGLKATIIPNCIDVDNYPRDSGGSNLHFDLLFTGKMDYRPNIDAVLWFAQKVWPLVRDARPETTWAIVGQKPHSRINYLSDIDGITISGWVPRIPPYMTGSKVYIMPFRVGSGTRLKLIEAMAAGKAVVSTTLGSEGFSLIDQQDLLIADEPKEFAQAVLWLLDQPEERAKLGRMARKRAAEYDWRIVIPRFENVYGSLTQ